MLHDPKWDVDEVGKALLAAANYIEEHGWCQKALRAPDGRVCIAGAIYLTNGADERGTFGRLRQYLCQGPASWNDEVCISKEQAIAALRAAAYAPVFAEATTGKKASAAKAATYK